MCAIKRYLSAMVLVVTSGLVGASALPASAGGPVSQQRPRWGQLAAGDAYSCGIRTDHTLWCWGNNSGGQLGVGSFTSRDHPARVGTQRDWVQVATGSTHTCGIRRGGSLWCWGDNVAGQLGVGDTHTHPSPVAVRHAVGWTDVSAGDGFTCAIDDAATLWCWGADALGQLGDGAPGPNKSRPEQIGHLTGWASLTLGLKWGCAIRTDRTAWCWGDGGGGVLGDGHQTSAYHPTRVLGGGHWSELSAGDNTTCGIQGAAAGTLWCWGSNFHSGLGIGQHGGKKFVPTQVGTDDSWRVVTAAGGSGCAVRTDGTLWCWGDDHDGQLGFRHQRPVERPARVGDLTTWTQVALGPEHAIGAHRALGGWAWGANGHGQLGDGTTVDRYAPVCIDGPGALAPAAAPAAQPLAA